MADSCIYGVVLLVGAEYEVAFKEVEEICRNGSRPDSSALGYLERGGGGGGGGESFAGNFSAKERRLWFDYPGGGDDDSMEIPCGFLKEFPIPESGLFSP